MEAISNHVLPDPKATEMAVKHLEDIKHTDLAFYAVPEEAVQELCSMPGVEASDLQRQFSTTRESGSVVGTLLVDLKNITSKVYVNGVLKFPCAECGKLHDRKARASDCRNSDLGIKPYK